MPDRDTRVWKPFLVDLKINQQEIGSAFVWQHEDGKDWLLPVDVLQRSRVRIPSTAPRVVQERIEYVSTALLPLGILTDRDILVETIALDVEARLFTASDLMSSPVTTVLEDAGLTEALGVMRGKRIRRLPVVNRAGGLVGMVTTDDLLDLLAAELSMLAGLVVEQPIKEERTRK